MSDAQPSAGDRSRTPPTSPAPPPSAATRFLERLRPGFGRSAPPPTPPPTPPTVVVDAATAAAVSRLQEVLGADDAADDALADVAAFVVGARREDAGGPVHYEVQVCVLRHDGTLELRTVLRRFRSFYDLFRRVRGTADVDLAKDTGDGPDTTTTTSSLSSGGEEDAFTARRKRELQRFLDEVAGDAAARRLPEVAAFLALDAAPDWTVPRFARDVLRRRECCCAHAAEVEAAAERARALEAALAACAAERDTARAHAAQLAEREAYLQTLAALHARELAAVEARASAAAAAAAQRAAAQEAQLAALLARANAVDRENAALRERERAAQRRAAWQQGAARAAADECAALRARVAALEARGAALAGRLRRAVEDANMLRALRAGAALPPPLTNADVLDYGGDDENDDENGVDKDKKDKEEEAVVGATEEEQRVAVRVWRQTLARCDTLGAAAERLAQQCAGLQAAAAAPPPRQRDEDEDEDEPCEALGRRAESLAAALCEAEHAQAAVCARAERETAAARAEADAAVEARDTARAQLAVAQETAAAATQRCAALERAPAAAAAHTRDTLLPTLGVLRGALCDAAAGLRTRAARAVLQRYLARQLVVEIALLRRELERTPPSSSHHAGTSSSSSTEKRRQLVYTRALAAGLEDWDRVEAQNAALEARVGADEHEAAALRARCDALATALAAEQAQRARLALALHAHGVDAGHAGADVPEAAVAERLALERHAQELEEQLADMRQRYFYSLAMDIKLQTQSTCDLATLYVDELPRAHITVAEWPRWLTQRMRESSPLHQSSP